MNVLLMSSLLPLHLAILYSTNQCWNILFFFSFPPFFYCDYFIEVPCLWPAPTWTSFLFILMSCLASFLWIRMSYFKSLKHCDMFLWTHRCWIAHEDYKRSNCFFLRVPLLKWMLWIMQCKMWNEVITEIDSYVWKSWAPIRIRKCRYDGDSYCLWL